MANENSDPKNPAPASTFDIRKRCLRLDLDPAARVVIDRLRAAYAERSSDDEAAPVSR